MKRLSHLYEKLVDVDHIEKCIHKAFKKKVKTRSIKKILSNPRKHAERISWLIKEGKLPFIRERKILLITDGKTKEETHYHKSVELRTHFPSCPDGALRREVHEFVIPLCNCILP